MTSKKNKTIAFIFVLLMFGSTFTYALINMFGEKKDEVKIPQEKILNYELNDQQKGYLLPKGYTLIVYSFTTGCLDCINVKKDLERITQNSDGQIYLQEIVKNEGISMVSIISLNGGKTINNPTNQELENTICDVLIQRPLWCVSAKV
ncbi:MAG: hypothetical protein NTW30_03050 [Candidatus Aenigmarchaeota archaeon]|nr:hypothetical protein [Candidatus Aenigmarchaeota archaeon]